MTKISSKDASIRNLEICKIAPVIPVLIIDDISTARDLGEALVAGVWPLGAQLLVDLHGNGERITKYLVS